MVGHSNRVLNHAQVMQGREPYFPPPRLHNVGTVPPKGEGDGHEVTVHPPPPRLHHTMVALKLQQFQ